MIALLSGIVFFFAAAGSGGHLSPYWFDDLSIGSEPPPCVEAGAVKDSLNVSDKGRLSDFTLGGSLICEHMLFDAGERDPYYDFVVQQSELRAKTVAQSLYDQSRANPSIRLPLYLDIKGGNAKLEAIVRASFSDELINLLGAGAVTRLPLASMETTGEAANTSTPHPTELEIELQRVDTSDLLFQIGLHYSDANGTRHRRSL